MNNSFPPKILDTWHKIALGGQWYTDLFDGKNDANCLHHIMGRGYKGQKMYQSIYNSCPVNNTRHTHNHAKYKHNPELLKRVRWYIDRAIEDGLYMKTKNDEEFLLEFKELYD